MGKSLIVILSAAMVLLLRGSGVLAAPVADFSHPDSNPYSPRQGANVGPYDAVNNGTITMWYHQYNKG
jgi:hypothetical protein